MFNSPLIREALTQETVKKRKKTLSRKIAIYAIVFTAAQLWWAQLVVWGLSIYHIHSGIWGPWLIMEGISSLLIACVRLAMMETARDTGQ